MNEMRIKTCVLGMVSTNCYLVYHDKTKAAVIIDPADNCQHILAECRALELVPAAILLTHGHFDHILAAEELRLACNCPIYANIREDALLRDPAMNLSGSFGTPEIVCCANNLIKDGEELELIGFTWKVIGTPGHTEGSTCYYIASEEVLFSGDTLFLSSMGRTDLPTGSQAAIFSSIVQKLLVLPEDTLVYPGHDARTTIAHERTYNPVARYGY